MNIDSNCQEEKMNGNSTISGVASTPILGSGINGDISYRDIPETKTYYPTLDEFSSPLQYIQSIRDEGMKYGIIKIKPPKGILCIIFILALNLKKNE